MFSPAPLAHCLHSLSTLVLLLLPPACLLLLPPTCLLLLPPVCLLLLPPACLSVLLALTTLLCCGWLLLRLPSCWLLHGPRH